MEICHLIASQIRSIVTKYSKTCPECWLEDNQRWSEYVLNYFDPALELLIQSNQITIIDKKTKQQVYRKLYFDYFTFL